MRGTLRKALSLAAAGSLLASCSAGGSSSSGGPTTVNATEKEWQISLASTTLPSGEITFKITNDGDKKHEFVIRKTDTPSDSLPTNDAGEVDEDAAGTEVGDPSEVEDVEPGSSDNTLTVTLQPGHYVIFCNIHDQDLLHYQKGMHTDFTVE